MSAYLNTKNERRLGGGGGGAGGVVGGESIHQNKDFFYKITVDA